MADLIEVAEIDEIAQNTAKVVTVGGKKIALFHVGDQFFAIDDTCPHRGGPLSEGVIEGDSVLCPWHAASFNLKTGAASGPPAPRGIATYRVVIQNKAIHLELP